MKFKNDSEITYEFFEKCLKHIQEHYEQMDKLCDILNCVPEISSWLADDIISCLHRLLDDQTLMIDWWVHETEFGTKHPTVYITNEFGEEQTHTIDSPKALWDFLTKEN